MKHPQQHIDTYYKGSKRTCSIQKVVKILIIDNSKLFRKICDKTTTTKKLQSNHKSICINSPWMDYIVCFVYINVYTNTCANDTWRPGKYYRHKDVSASPKTSDNMSGSVMWVVIILKLHVFTFILTFCINFLLEMEVELCFIYTLIKPLETETWHGTRWSQKADVFQNGLYKLTSVVLRDITLTLVFYEKKP